MVNEMSNLTVSEILENALSTKFKIVSSGIPHMRDGHAVELSDEEKIAEAERQINELIREAVYGFHEYIMGKNIIKEETDQTFNYARLHHALDDYIARLKQTEVKDEN
jgi:Ser-tRNA(Ala) deacylase AlaX